jgi:hypothetical protein
MAEHSLSRTLMTQWHSWLEIADISSYRHQARKARENSKIYEEAI